MKRCFSEKRAQVSFSVGRFVLMNHKGRGRKVMVKIILWLNQKRFNKNVLDFLEIESTKDDSF
jgi:hypothetical protein